MNEPLRLKKRHEKLCNGTRPWNTSSPLPPPASAPLKSPNLFVLTCIIPKRRCSRWLHFLKFVCQNERIGSLGGVGGGRRQVHPSGSANASERRVCEMASDLITTVYCAFYFTKNNQFICKTNQILTKNVVCIIAIRFTQLHLCTSFQFIFLEFIIHKILTNFAQKKRGAYVRTVNTG